MVANGCESSLNTDSFKSVLEMILYRQNFNAFLPQSPSSDILSPFMEISIYIHFGKAVILAHLLWIKTPSSSRQDPES